MEDAIVYCPQCGAASEQPQQQAYQQPQQPQQQAYQQQAYQQQNYQQQAYQQPYQPYQQPVAPRESGLATVAKIFMIIGTVASALSLFLIPLAWCIPMTMAYWKKLKTGEPISVGFKICTLLFVNTIAGILMLCDKDH